MKGTLRYLLLGMTVWTLLAGCEEKIEPGHTAPPPPPEVTASLIEVQVSRRPQLYEAVGTVQARAASTLSSKLMGSVKTVRVSEGDLVRRGDLLVVIEQMQADAGVRLNQAALAEARRALTAAESARKAAAAEAELAAATFRRYEKLLKQDSVSRQEFDEVNARYQQAQANLAQAESMGRAAAERIAQAEAGLDSAQATRGDTQIQAPYDGIVTAKYVQAGDLAAPGTPLLAIEGRKGYRVDLVLPETYVAAVAPGQSLQVIIPNLGGDPLGGTVQAVVPTADAASRTFLVKVDLPAGLKLHSGLFARVTIPVGSEAAIRIPAASLIRRGQLTGVHTVDSDRLAHFRLVRTGRVQGDEVEILSGLQEGDRIVATAVAGLADGVAVKEAP